MKNPVLRKNLELADRTREYTVLAEEALKAAGKGVMNGKSKNIGAIRKRSIRRVRKRKVEFTISLKEFMSPYFPALSHSFSAFIKESFYSRGQILYGGG